MASRSFRKPFWAVYLSAAGPRAALYSVNKVGKVECNLSLTRHSEGEQFGNLAEKFA